MSDTGEGFVAILCCPVCSSPQDVVNKRDAQNHNFECENCGTLWSCVVSKERVEEFGHG